jgi:hypothetical protein
VTCCRCHRAMRQYRTRIADYPNTVVHACRGLCRQCYKIEPAYTKKEAEDRPSIEQIKATLQAYLDRRRPYRIKAGAL